MMSSVFVFVWAVCLLLAAVWPMPVVPPLNRQYRDWDHDPAWQLFQRQRRRYYIFIYVTVIAAVISIHLAVILM